MNTSFTLVRRTSFAIFLALAFALFGITPLSAFAETSTSAAVSSSASSLASSLKNARAGMFTDEFAAGDFYFAQSGSGRCTIASTAMMVRRAAFLDGKENWRDIDEAYVSADGHCGAGVKNEFETAGYSISYVSIDSSKEALIELLEDHPEGIAAYDSGVPHAVLLTDYDENTDTFYCADPANFYSGSRIPVAESWNGERHGGNQDAVIAGFSSAWIIVE